MFEIKEYKSTKLGFGEGLKVLGKKYQNIVALGSDITSSVGMDIFANAYPQRFYSMGIAEQNIAGVAAGMALSDKIPFFSTYGVFAALRATDQVRISICYNNLPVKIGGAHAGISVGHDGATHQALEDIAIMRSLPNMTVLSPCDATQTKLATIAAVEQADGPVYIRFGRDAVPDFTSDTLKFKLGKAQILRKGTDVAIIATGHMTWEALQAAIELEKQGVDACVVNLHTIKPIDKDTLINVAKITGAVVTVEEHQIMGGMGSAVAEVLAGNYPVPIEFIGMNDCYGESGEPAELLAKFGMKAINIIDTVKKLISNRK